MKGETLKRRLELAGYQQTDKEFALKVGLTVKELNSALKSEDVKTSVLEKVQRSLHLPWDFFFVDGEKDCRTLLGPIIVNTAPLLLRESQYELRFFLKEKECLKYLVVASIHISDKHGREIQVYTPETYHLFRDEFKSEGGTIYFLFLDDDRCAIRYADGSGTIHEQFIGDYGLRITLEPSGEPGQFLLRLFRDTKELSTTTTSYSNFEHGLRHIWHEFESREYEERNKK